MIARHDLLARVRAFVATRFGLDFPDGRRPDLERALSGLLAAWSPAAPEALNDALDALPDGSSAMLALIRHVTVGETYFFRDRGCFDALERHVLPELIADRRARGLRSLRIWSAGCSTGEEPYSLAILLDRLLPDRADWSLTILGTDLNEEALAKARIGHFRNWSLRETPAWVRERYFRRRGRDDYELHPAIRSMVTLAALNLAGDRYPDNTHDMDLILCRNVLMYFTSRAAKAAMTRLQSALVCGGWLVTSAVEMSAEPVQSLAPVHFPGAILYRKGSAGPAAGPAAPQAWTDAGAGALAPLAAAPPPLPSPLPPLPPLLPPLLPHRPPTLSRPANTAPAGTTAIRQPDPGAALQHARELAGAGLLPEARQRCLELLNADALNPEAHLLHATICQAMGDAGTARAALSRTLYLEPGAALAHYFLGTLLFQQGQRRRARRCLENALQLLAPVPPEAALPWGGGLTAGSVVTAIRFYLQQV